MGRTRRIAIGLHGKYTPDLARENALSILTAIAKGGDPSADRQRLSKEITVSKLCDLYLLNGCADKKSSTLATDKGRIERHIKPLLGNHRVVTVTRADVAKAAIGIENGKTALTVKTKSRGVARVRGGSGAASRTMGLLGAIFACAVNEGVCQFNPVHGVKKAEDHRRDRFLTDTETQKLGRVLEEAKHLNNNGIRAIRLLLLTGCRKNEILSLQWKYIDWDNSCLRLPDSKTSSKVVPIGNAVIDLLKTIPRINGSNYVLSADRGVGHYTGLQKVWVKVRELAEISDVKIHDLRRTFGSTSAIQGESLLTIGKLLGHSNPSTTAIYAHLTDKVVSRAASAASGYLSKKLAQGAADNE